MLPKTLQDDKLRFCRVRYKTKKPFEKDWTNKLYTWQEIEKFEGENYGILCGHGNLAVIDCDKEELQLAVKTLLPETYRVKTGGGGMHNYFFIKDLKQKIILETDAGDHLGEVQSYGTQVVGPGSLHPNGKKYEAIDEGKITVLGCDELLEFIKPFVKLKETQENAEDEKKYEGIDALKVEKIWGVKGMSFRNGEYYGEHPIHGSEGGSNFWINPSKNAWHCFRCDSGGGPLSAIAVKEKIIDCHLARKGLLRGKEAFTAIQRAEEKYGLEKGERDAKEEKSPEEKINLLWDTELLDFEEEDKEWIIDKLIPSRSICILTGKRGTMKTFIALIMAYSISSGKDFLENFHTKQGGVIYLDKENGIPIMKKRTTMIRNGMGIDEKQRVGFICFSQLKIDKNTDVWKIEELIEEHKPKLLIIDTYRRGITFDENDAGEVSKLFVDVLRPIVEKHEISILLIHHDRKGRLGGTTDEMDEIRGSSDLANYADIILKTQRAEGGLILKQLKNRNAKEEEPLKLTPIFEEDQLKMVYEGNYEKHTQAERCIEILTLWITENKLNQFQTREAKDVAFRAGIKESNFKNALNLMIDSGIINKSSKGWYDMIS